MPRYEKPEIRQYLKRLTIDSHTDSRGQILYANRPYNPSKAKESLEEFVKYYYGSKELDPATLCQRRAIANADVLSYYLSCTNLGQEFTKEEHAEMLKKYDASLIKNAKKYYANHHNK